MYISCWRVVLIRLWSGIWWRRIQHLKQWYQSINQRKLPKFFADLETWQRKQRRRGYSCAWHRSNIRKNRSKRCVDFLKKIIDVRKTTWYVFFEKKEIILKANLLKGRVAKPEGTKVRKLDHVSRLPLFPYHHNIWKRCLNRRDSDTFYTI